MQQSATRPDTDAGCGVYQETPMRKRSTLFPSLVVAVVTGAVLFGAPVARADDAPIADRPAPEDDASRHVIDRTWLYADDARVPAPMTVIGTVIGLSSVSYTNVGSSVSRIASPYPNTYNGFADNTAQPGGMIAVGGEVGLLPRISVMALGQMGIGGADGVPNPSAGSSGSGSTSCRRRGLIRIWSRAAATFARRGRAPSDDDNGKWLPGSPSGDNGAWIQAAFSGDVGRFRLATTVHGEHVFSTGRDPLDVMVEAGTSYRIVGCLPCRPGVCGTGSRGVVQPRCRRCGATLPGASPIASLQLLGDRLSMVAGPAIGLSSLSPAFVGRFALAYGF
jgi:hypothetical protein